MEKTMSNKWIESASFDPQYPQDTPDGQPDELEMKLCPLCAKPFVLVEIKDPGIELRHESKGCPLDGYLQWFETKEQAINSPWFDRPIEDIVRSDNDRMRDLLRDIVLDCMFIDERTWRETIKEIDDIAKKALDGGK
jgi:hypothetical protein